MNSLPFLSIYILPLSVLIGYGLGGAYNFLALVFVFGLLPLLDVLVGKNTRNPSEQEEETLSESRVFRFITWACMPVQVILVVWGAYVVTHQSLTPIELTGFVLSVGITSGALGINVSHELIHRVNNRLEPFLGKIMLATVCYLHWAIEHVRGHHRTVATPPDPATARRGESFYAFWPRTVLGGLQSAHQIEADRLARQGKQPGRLQNAVHRYVAIELVIAAALWWSFGFGAVLFFLAQSLVAVSLLEAVNYLEHYGMERRTRPQLPNGYAGMVLLALVPPLWRWVMDKRLP